jgi:hypothetical protein
LKQVIAEPGSLVFFFGAKTFHRAAPITGQAFVSAWFLPMGRRRDVRIPTIRTNGILRMLLQQQPAAAALVVAHEAHEST